MFAKLFLVSILGAGFCLQHGSPVSTLSGDILGMQKNLLGKDINVYLGIPFAKPPVGDRRFRRPEPVESWTDAYEATELPPACSSQSFGFLGLYENEIYRTTPEREDEDCLYLNIWAPEGIENAAVMIWIHGGAFVEGHMSTPLFDGVGLAASQDVIVVSLQYRLGVLGFLYLGTEEAPGNMALLDQQMAMKWVHDNIRQFGGDPDRITIFGESAGGASGQLHALSNLPKYFKNVIIQSAPSLELFGYHSPETALNTGYGIIDALGCKDETISESISCLRKLDISFIKNNLQIPLGFVRSTIDNYFFVKPPEENYPDVRGINFIIGANANEGYLGVSFLHPPLAKEILQRPSISYEDYSKIAGTMIVLLANIKDEEKIVQVRDFYQKHEDGDYLAKLDALFNDMYMTCSSIDMAERFAEHGNVYMYRLMQRSSACMFPEWWGVAHGCELDLVFGIPLVSSSPRYSKTDAKLSRTIVDFWGNFAKTGDPNFSSKDDSKSDRSWPIFNKQDEQYLVLKSDVSVGNSLRSNNCLFWENLKTDNKNKMKDEF